MINDTDMLSYICKDADMGCAAVSHVIKLTKNNQLRCVLEEQLSDYQHSYTAAANLLPGKGEIPHSSNALAKTMTYVSTDFQTLTDRSPSKIAELVIQGNTMGITTITKQLHQYDGSNDKITALAKQQIAMEQSNIEALKAFL